MTNILIIIATDRFSGPARQIVQFVERLDPTRFKAIFASTLIGQAPTEFFQEIWKRGLKIVPLRQSFCFDPMALYSAYKAVQRESIHVLETHGYKACVIGFALKLALGKPWIHFMHGHTLEHPKMSLYFWLEFQLTRFADRIVTVSEEMNLRLSARGLPSRKIVTVHNAIDPEQFHVSTTPPSRAGLNVTSGEKLIGVIGRLSPEKGQDVFLEAFHLMVGRHDNLKAILIGEGPFEERLRRKVVDFSLEGRVVFAGYQPDIADYYPLFDLLVIPSRSEGLPNVAMEALHFGLPVVATAVGGTPEVIIHGQTGIIVEPEDPEGLANAITEVISNHEMSSSFIKNGRELIVRNFSPTARQRKIEEIFSDMSRTEK